MFQNFNIKLKLVEAVRPTWFELSTNFVELNFAKCSSVPLHCVLTALQFEEKMFVSNKINTTKVSSGKGNYFWKGDEQSTSC